MTGSFSQRWLGTAWAAVAVLSAESAEARPSIQTEEAPLVGEPVQLSIEDFPADASSVTWDFGDGSQVSDDQQVSHTYAAPGNYQVFARIETSSGLRTAEVLLFAHQAAVDPPPSHGGTVLFDEALGQSWNVNPDHGSVTVVGWADPPRVLGTRPVGKRPRTLSQAPNGVVWVTVQGDDRLVGFDPATGEELYRTELAYGSQPYGLAFDAEGRGYVSLMGKGQLLVIDATGQPLETLEIGPWPGALSIVGQRLFVTQFISTNDHGVVREVSLDALEVIRLIELPFDEGPDTESTGRGVPNYLTQVRITPDGKRAFVTAKKDNVARGPQRDGLSMNSDSFVRSILCVLDLDSGAELVELRADIDNRGLPVDVAFAPWGNYVFVLAQANNFVGVHDAYSLENVGGLRDLGKAPDGLALTTRGQLLVHGFLSRELLAVDVRQVASGRDLLLPAPHHRVPTTGEEVLAPEVLLGKKVFYDAADTRMSDDGYMACMSCHLEGFHDGRIWDLTDRGEGLRNTKSLLGIRGTKGQGRVHWSANFDEIQDFERDIRESLDGSGFMSEEDWELRKDDPFGLSSAGVSPELDGLAAYLESLDEVPRSPRRNPDGSMTAGGLRGEELFSGLACPGCHSGKNFTDSPSEVLHDLGTIEPSSGSRLGGPLQGIDTPSLLGIWSTPPYLHDGRAESLGEVFGPAHPHHQQLVESLSSDELKDLLTYLLQIDGRDAGPQKSVSPTAGGLGGASAQADDQLEGRFGCACQAASSPGPGTSWAVWTSLGLLAWLWRRRRALATQVTHRTGSGAIRAAQHVRKGASLDAPASSSFAPASSSEFVR